MDLATASVAEADAQSFFRRCGRILINGDFVPPRNDQFIPAIDPATEQVIAHVPAAGRADVDTAVAAARNAFEHGPWSRMNPSERARLMYRLADAVERNMDELALLETLDNGKPLKASRSIDVMGSAEKLRYFAGWVTKIGGETASLSAPGDWHAYTLREPVGVAALIVPWNFPLMMAVTKMAPALAAGCTVILKPAEQTSLTALRLGELVQEVGFPAGVVNIVTGYGEIAGAALAEHPGVDKISFTGSTEVGKLILRAAAGNLKRVTLELGGKSPVLVFPDADIEAAVAGVSRFIFSNSGQVCAAGSRLYAHRKIFDALVSGIAEKAKSLKVGPGVDASAEMGPLVSEEQLDRVLGYMRSGIEAGASLVAGGSRLDRRGYFVAPTIFTGTTCQMAVQREEVFGPVLCAAYFDEDGLDAIAAEANNTDYGLSAYIWTRDLGVAHKLARKLKAGFVRVNGGPLDNALPFGGYKQSGWGRENAKAGIDAYTEVKAVAIAL